MGSGREGDGIDGSDLIKRLIVMWCDLPNQFEKLNVYMKKYDWEHNKNCLTFNLYLYYL